GERFGPERATEEFLVDESFSVEELSEKLPHLIRGCEKIYFQMGQDSDCDQIVLQARKKAQQLDRRSGQALKPLFDPNAVLGQMRVIKDDHEINWMRESCELSAQSHQRVMRRTRPGLNERQLQGEFLYGIHDKMAMREGYSSIVASGENATILHYRANNKNLMDGEFLLIDAGGEKNYYTADITRTYPVNGIFTKTQKEFYEHVLRVQETLIQHVQPGFSITQLQEKACILLTEALIELGILSGKVSHLVEDKSYQKYYPHGIGHYLGMDVHDVGLLKQGDQPVALETGMVLTIEPGLYIPANDDKAPKELRGLGVRIEDDILVGKKDPENLTIKAPKSISDLEAIVGASSKE
ncbi:MAG: aminopeptidase P family protein, partial [Pseudomonadota bacterium]